MRLRAIVLALLFAASAAAAVNWKAEGNRWWAHVQYLASDALEGRNTGSTGYEKAAEYVAEQFRREGLEPAGTSKYFQPVQFVVQQIDESRSSLELMREDKAQPVRLGVEAIIRMRGEPAEDLTAGAVFVGYGLSIMEERYDDLAGLDLRGKIAVFLAGGPPSIPGPLKAHAQSTEERWKALQRTGAVGMAVIFNPKNLDLPWERIALARLQPSMDLADPALQEAHGLRLALAINPAHADEFFAGSGHTIAELLAEADTGRPLPRFPLAVTIRARVAVKRSRAESPNVIGVLPGSDPKLKDEYVVISAHLDHVGVGLPIHGDRIYNGAMDDASGVASVIEIARYFHESKERPKRSLLFVAFTGEEKGELGSNYFAEHATVAGDAIVADINMDMYLPLFPLRYVEVQGLDESTLGEDIRAAATAADIEVQADKEPEANRFIRSDQYSFIRRGVPALAFKFGWRRGSPEEKIFHAWYKQRYHAPSDDTHQPVDKQAAARFTHLLYSLVRRVADAPSRPHWLPESFFRRFAK